MSVKVKVTQSCPTLYDLMNYTVHGILQARILEWVAFPFSRGSSQPRDQTQVSRTAGGFFTSWVTKGSPRILEWIAYPFSSGSSWPRNQSGVSCIASGSFTNLSYQGSQIVHFEIVKMVNLTYILPCEKKTINLFSYSTWKLANKATQIVQLRQAHAC